VEDELTPEATDPPVEDVFVPEPDGVQEFDAPNT
jgi:hypothetical protein